MAKETRYVTPKGRVSFPALDKPRAAPNSTVEKFSITLIFDQEAQKTPAFAALAKAAKDCAFAKFGEQTVDALRKAGKWNSAFHKGEEKTTSTGERMPAYEDGTLFITASSKYESECLDGAMGKIAPGDVYAGSYARASVVPFAFDNAGNKGVSWGLRNVQLVGHGEKLGGGGRSSATEDFDAVPDFQPADLSAANREPGDPSLPF
jgi:hypothetical protein